MAEVAGAERRAEGSAPARREPVPSDTGRMATTTGPGGAAVTRSLGQLAVQAKSTVGATTDPREREADAVAEHVTRRTADDKKPELVSAAPPAIRRQTEDRAAADEGGTASDRVQSLIDASTGLGGPLPPQARIHFESAFGRDFGDVRVHDDAAANEAAGELRAVAFTRGQDIYFASGAYDPDSEAGRRLIAHELTHVVQQTGRAEAPIRRKPAADKKKPAVVNKATPSPGPVFDNPEHGKIDTNAKKGEIPKLTIPTFKKDLIGTLKHPVTLRRSSETRSTQQIANWEKAVLADVETQIANKVKQNPGPHYLYYKHSRFGKQYFIGTPKEIAPRVARPPWDKTGASAQFDVDHKQEYQLGGDDTTPADNLWLLDFAANRSAGSSIRAEIAKQRDGLIAAARPHLTPKPQAKTILREYTFNVKELAAGPDPAGAKTFWTAAEAKTDKIAKPLRRVPQGEAAKLRGTARQLAIFSNSTGGSFRSVPFDKNPAKPGKWEKKGLFRIDEVYWKPPAGGVQPGAQVGYVVGRAFHGEKGAKKIVEEIPVQPPIIGMSNVENGGFLSAQNIRSAKAAAFSPLDFGPLEFDVVHGLLGRGRILPDLPLLKDRAEIALVLDERGLGLAATLTAGSFNLPGPFQITGGFIELFAGGGEPRLELTGQINFEIEKLANGFFRASVATGGKFGVEGELNFDTSIFTEAKLGVRYRDGKWGVTGRLAIGEGKVTGIKRAAAGVTIDGDKVSADGEFESSLKGLKSGKLGFAYDPATGTTIEGQLTLRELPGIKGGTVKAKVAQKKSGEGWSLSGEITAEPNIPGVTGSVTGRYEDGAFLAVADLGYQKGLLDGRLKLGVTNQRPGSDGRPAGPPEPGLLLVYGRGQASLKLTPWLIGTATVEVRPNGTVAVAGRIALPDRFELFKRQELNRRIFAIGIDIPVVGVAVLGQRIGIFATIGGGLDLVAGIGPGMLLGTGVEVSYDPERENATRVEGQTQLHVPADAGLRLFVQGGIGAGIPVVSATAGVELAGRLGIAGALSAALNLLWTRSSGLVLDAEARFSASPVFRFTADAFVLVQAEIFRITKEIYSRKWKLAAFDYGPSLTFGVTLPVHAERGDFQFSFDHMRFTYPSIDPADTARSVLRSVFDR